MQCTFAIDHYNFNLCPLFDTKLAPFDIIVEEDTPPTYTKYVYSVSFGGPLKRDGTLPAELQCPEGTRICLIIINTRPDHPSEPSRILQVVPVAAGEDLLPKVKIGEIEEDSKHGPLQLTLHGGRYKEQRQKATFFFHCDEGMQEPSQPSYEWQFDGTHAFSWKTRHACHKLLSEPQPEPMPDPDPPQVPPRDPDSDSEVNNDRGSSWTRFIFILFWVVLILFILRVFLLCVRRRYNRGRGSYISLGQQRSPFSSTQLLSRSFLSRETKKIGGVGSYHRAYADSEEEVALTPCIAPPKAGKYGGL